MTGGWRERVCGELSGEVLEIGFGSGTNLGHYGDGVTRVLAVEPSDRAWEIAQDRIIEFGRPVDRIGLDGARLDLPDASVDAVVSTWTMCTIPHLADALAETRRVLRPGGTLHFVEHSLAPTKRIARIQHTIQPTWGRAAGGCHLNRDIPGLLAEAGFTVPDLKQRYASGLWPSRPFGWFVTGTAQP
ncbi:SAM-dependent methyltransferase [Aeromicrobium sp. A1-2]|nr:class I SAM-dependent methyltransferase [Aeromicrobium sp. A1-2]AXT83753.1 SAM-dependent methyltransferase [Aeromicrobium sp. A1-2]